MNPDEMISGSTYWAIRYGSVEEVIFQTPLLGRPPDAKPGYLFTIDGIRPVILWAIDLPYVFASAEEAFNGLGNYYVSKARECRVKAKVK